MPEPILREAFDGWEEGNGIFNALQNLSDDLPWKDDPNVDQSVLDIEYFGNHSGSKFCSPIVKHLLGSSDTLSEAARITLAKIILSKYFHNWKSLWATNVAEYNPIHNYDMVEHRVLKGADSEAQVETDSTQHTGTDTLSHGLTQTTTHGRGNEETDYKYGINTDTSDPKPSDRSVSQESGQTATVDSGSDVTTKNLQDTSLLNRNKVGANEEEEDLSRSGNIGVTTTQQMLTAERELWVWNYFDQVFKDLDRELALMVFDPCRV